MNAWQDHDCGSLRECAELRRPGRLRRVPAPDMRGVPGGRRAGRAPAGRVCSAEGCDTVLSVYNRKARCSLHAELIFSSPSPANPLTGIPLELSFQERSCVAPDSSRLPDLGGPQTADGSPRPRFHAQPPYALRVGQIAIRGGWRMKRILLAVDGSDHSQRATAVAEDLKPKMGGVELIVFHAHEEGIGSPMEVPQAGRPPCEWHCGGAHQGWCECAGAKPRGHTVGGLHRRSIQAAKRQTTSI